MSGCIQLTAHQPIRMRRSRAPISRSRPSLAPLAREISVFPGGYPHSRDPRAVFYPERAVPMPYDHPNSSGFSPAQDHHQRTPAGHPLRRREQLGPWRETGEILPERTAPQKRPPFRPLPAPLLRPLRLTPPTNPLPGIDNPRSITTNCSPSSGPSPAMPPAPITPPNATPVTIDLPLRTEIRP